MKTTPSIAAHRRPAARSRHGAASRKPGQFTPAEHLQVQRAIEKRAHQLSRRVGGSGWNPLNNWLRAEAQVIAEFIARRLTTAHPYAL